MIAFCRILCYSIIAAQQQARCCNMQVTKPFPRIKSGEISFYHLWVVRMFLHQRPHVAYSDPSDQKEKTMVEKIAEENQLSNYKLIDLLKLVCAFLVIGIHTRPFQASSELLDKVFYYDISNYAVPFFYACTGYFLVLNHPEETLQTKSMSRCIKILKIYLLWSAVYLPLTVCGWFFDDRSGLRYLAFCLRNYVVVGENFYSWTLWYLNGLVFALFLIGILSKRLSIKQISDIGTFAYLAGIGLTMLARHLTHLPLFLARAVQLYFSIFVTTRNGLFMSLVFVSLGMRMAETNRANEWKPSIKTGLLAGGLYIVKVCFSLIGGGELLSKLLDLPTFWFLFELILYECKKEKRKGTFYKQLRGLCRTIYLVHMYLVAFCSLVLYKEDYHNFTSFFICAGGSTILALLWQIHKKENVFCDSHCPHG